MNWHNCLHNLLFGAEAEHSDVESLDYRPEGKSLWMIPWYSRSKVKHACGHMQAGMGTCTHIHFHTHHEQSSFPATVTAEAPGLDTAKICRQCWKATVYHVLSPMCCCKTG